MFVNLSFAPRSGVGSPTREKEFRFDIQFLRGVAVILVVLYHGFGDAFPKGFLGVDIFFVVSGFLITRIILKDLERGTFGATFYLRRAKRLLPAAYSTFAFTTLASYFLLTSPQWSSYLLQLGGSIAFAANIVLWQTTDYFAASAETKPLLHIWSLSLEEQFYLLLPPLLWMASARHRILAIFILFLTSLVACVLLVSQPHLQTFAFYMLAPRAWELLAGSICAWVALRRPALTAPNYLKLAALGLMLYSAVRGFDVVHPRGDALIVVGCTALIILGDGKWLPQSIFSRPVAVVGDWSYSLYLIHWPLFSFAYIAFMGEPPMAVLASLAVLAFILAWLQYRFIETPFRYHWRARPRAAWVAFAAMTAGVFFVAAPAVWSKLVDSPQQFVDLRANVGLAMVCRQGEGPFRDLPACRTSDMPSAAVWGDSNAMHLVRGLDDFPMIQITKPACAPILGVAAVSTQFSPSAARDCASFNESAFARIAGDDHIRVVVLSSPFIHTFVEQGQYLLLDGRIEPWRDVAPARFAETLRRLRRAGKTPIVVGPIPRAAFDPGACLLRQAERVPVLGRADCNIRRHELEPSYLSVISSLRDATAEAGSLFLIPESVLCSGSICRTQVGRTAIYRDDRHLTHAGSEYLARTLGIIDQVRRGTAPSGGAGR